MSKRFATTTYASLIQKATQDVQSFHLLNPCLPIDEDGGAVEAFFSKSLDISVMDDSFFKRVLFEWIRDRKKEQMHAKQYH
jgi:hypothetical protein